MSKELTHALAATTMQCTLNGIMGNAILDERVFIAAVFSMMINIDRSSIRALDVRVRTSRSPLGHSIVGAAFIIYIANLVINVAGNHITPLLNDGLMLTFASAFTTHFLLDLLDGDIFLFPTTPDISKWLDKYSTNTNGEWGAWCKFSLKGRIKVSQISLNLLFAGTLVCYLMMI